jgi:hypothetical protein
VDYDGSDGRCIVFPLPTMVGEGKVRVRVLGQGRGVGCLAEVGLDFN